ncbi:MAG TPA: phosphate signaling complex protein PhoU [Phycisphaerales bacterium]|jgi:phosphate transport system protein|nr:phosphate signaling complex protein PhoU [Phycisphaerales bacterium]
MAAPAHRDEPPRPGGIQPTLVREVSALKRRLIDEATAAVGMLEAALAALWELDTTAAEEILKRDDRIDREEVAIEETVFRLMALQSPVARDFRMLAFVLKTNNQVERIGDHACSVAKIALKLAAIHQAQGRGEPMTWPTSLVELGQRVPMACHRCLRALLDEDPALAKQIVVDDRILDKLNRQLFDETITLMRTREDSHAIGLHIYRVGRELERVGDLMTNIAEDVVYLATGEIIRHEKKRLREQAEGGATP